MPVEIRPGFAVYLTGLPSSGKTTLAQAIRDVLSQAGISVQVIDSDEMRLILTPHPTYSSQERDWFYEALAFIAALLVNNGINVIIAATAPLRAHRQAARARIDRITEVHLSCPVEVCRARDPKGLWEQADAGKIKTLPGAGAPYEPPESPEMRVNTGHLSAEAAANLVINQLKQKGYI